MGMQVADEHDIGVDLDGEGLAQVDVMAGDPLGAFRPVPLTDEQGVGRELALENLVDAHLGLQRTPLAKGERHARAGISHSTSTAMGMVYIYLLTRMFEYSPLRAFPQPSL